MSDKYDTELPLLSNRHPMNAELLALRKEPHTPYEGRLLDVIVQLYGLIGALQLSLRLKTERALKDDLLDFVR